MYRDAIAKSKNIFYCSTYRSNDTLVKFYIIVRSQVIHNVYSLTLPEENTENGNKAFWAFLPVKYDKEHYVSDLRINFKVYCIA